MARKKEPEKPANHERWLVSYGDFVTLLFAVFVTLYAMSQTDKRKVDEVVASMRESFGYSKVATSSNKISLVSNIDLKAIPSIKPEPMTPGMGKSSQYQSKAKTTVVQKDFGQLRIAIDKLLKESGAADKSSVQVTRRGLVVSLREGGFFNSGSSSLTPQGVVVLDRVASTLARYANPIRVEGHTDNTIPAGGDKVNWDLSALRAVAVLSHLLEHWMFDPATSTAVGYGQYHPEYPNNSETARAMNRRVDIVMLTPASAAIEFNR